MAFARFFNSLLSELKTVEMILIHVLETNGATIGSSDLLLHQVHARIGRLASKPRSDGTHVHFGKNQLHHPV